MPFLLLDNANDKFTEKLGKFSWRFYTAVEILSTTKLLELIDKNKFAKIAINKNSETFIVHISTLVVLLLSIHLSKTI